MPTSALGSAVGDDLCRGFMGCILVISAIFVACVTFASIGIGVQNWNTVCDDACFMSMPLWVILIGIISLVFAVASMILYFFKHKEPVGFFGAYTGIAWVFVTPFAIMGSRILYQQAGLCYDMAYPLWAVFMTALVLDWIIVATTTIIGLIVIVIGCAALCGSSRC